MFGVRGRGVGCIERMLPGGVEDVVVGVGFSHRDAVATYVAKSTKLQQTFHDHSLFLSFVPALLFSYNVSRYSLLLLFRSAV